MYIINMQKRTKLTRGGLKMENSKFIDESIEGSASAKNITIRMQLDDLNGIKKMAKAAGMPYQTLINSIIHRYVTGGIVFKVAV